MKGPVKHFTGPLLIMNKVTKNLLILSLLLLIPPFFLPLWSITLEAPQYPEGLGLYIGISDITGHNPHDLVNINLVNHYIGMKEIRPDSFPELVYMPWILVGLMVMLALVILKKSRSLLLAYVIVFMLLAIVGLADFWYWNYDYGHNLHTETAAIKIPGASYQPPVFGTKQMLNFTTTSLPGPGGLSAIFSLAIAACSFVLDLRRK